MPSKKSAARRAAVVSRLKAAAPSPRRKPTPTLTEARASVRGPQAR